jgi:type I restriction enzyme S subunit
VTQLQIAPWLNESRWPTVPIRFMARLGTGHTPSRSVPEYWENCDVPWITLADVWQLRDGKTDIISDTKEKISKVGLGSSAAVKHPAGTVILSRTASVGFSAIMGADMATSQDFATWTCGPSLFSRYLLHALRAAAPDLKRVAAGSTHKTIYMPDIEQLRIPAPPLEEQCRIADFLDAETARIDKLQMNRSRQVAALKERELAVIYSHFAGIDEPGDKQATDWRWLPHVPGRWRIAPVYSLYDVRLGKMLNAERASGGNLRPYLRNANVTWYSTDTSDLAMMDFSSDEFRRYSVEVGDLLVCEGGAGVAEAAVWHDSKLKVFYQKSLHRVRRRSNVPVEWLMYWLRITKAIGLFASEGNIATIPHLTGEQLRESRIPVPVNPERRVAEISKDIERLQAALQLLSSASDLTVERRQALITAAVTGQIDVTTARGVDVS